MVSFQYLMFSFKEDDNNFYCVTESSQITDMITTMKHDREELKKLQNEIDVYKRKAEFVEAKETALLAEIELLKAKLKVQNNDYKL